MNNRELGIIGEDTAARLLSCEGYEIVARNYRCRFGDEARRITILPDPDRIR